MRKYRARWRSTGHRRELQGTKRKLRGRESTGHYKGEQGIVRIYRARWRMYRAQKYRAR